MNALEKVVDLLAAICVMFLVPLLYYESSSAVLQTALLGETGEWFLKQISTSGELSGSVLREFERELEAYGCERYELIRTRVLYEPDGANSVLEREYTAEKQALYLELEEKGTCSFLRGDKIRLVLYTREAPVVYYTTIRSGEAAV